MRRVRSQFPQAVVGRLGFAVQGRQVSGGGAVAGSSRGSGASAAGIAFAAVLGLLSLGAAPASAADCPNAAIRAQSNVNPATGQPYAAMLPGCRSYEKVSPDAKGSADPGGLRVGGLGASPLGDAFAWKSQGNFGAEGSIGGTFLSRRGASGWTTANVVVPQRLIGGLIMDLANREARFAADRSAVLWCGWVVDSGGPPAASDPPYPFACAKRGGDGNWTRSPLMEPVDGVSNDGGSVFELGGSADFSHVVVQSQTRYLADDTSTGTSLYELVDPFGDDASLRLVNVDNAGNVIGPASIPVLGSAVSRAYQAVSQDGDTIYFTATPSGGVATLYARLDGASTVAISNPSPAECTTCDPAAKAPTYVGASRDGQRVFFTTTQQLRDSDTDTTADLYLYDLSAGPGQHLVQVSGGGAGDVNPGNGAAVSGAVAMAQDGTRVYFISSKALTTLPNGLGQVATPGSPNLYVYQRDAEFPNGRTRFVATVAAGEVAGLTAPVGSAFATPDGRYLVWSTSTQVVGAGPTADTDLGVDVYRYDAQTGAIDRVSVGEPGYPASANGNSAGRPAGTISRTFAAFATPGGGGSSPISDDGSRIVFHTTETLQVEDVNETANTDCVAAAALGAGCDVYLWDAGDVSLVSDGSQGVSPSTLAFQGGAISASGDDVFFASGSQLIPQDQDDNVDFYSARIGGGFPYTRPEECLDAAACRSSWAAPVAAVPPASVASGAGNLSTPRTRLSVGRVSARALVRARRTGRLALRVTTTSAGRIRVVARARLASRLRTVARGAANAGLGSPTTLTLTLARAARRALRKRAVLPLTVEVRQAGARARLLRVRLPGARR